MIKLVVKFSCLNLGPSKLLRFSSKSLEKTVVTRFFSDIVTNSSFCTSDSLINNGNKYNVTLFLL